MMPMADFHRGVELAGILGEGLDGDFGRGAGGAAGALRQRRQEAGGDGMFEAQVDFDVPLRLTATGTDLGDDFREMNDGGAAALLTFHQSNPSFYAEPTIASSGANCQ